MKFVRRRLGRPVKRSSRDTKILSLSEAGHHTTVRPAKSRATLVGIGIFVLGLLVLGASRWYGTTWAEVGASFGTGLLLAGFVLWLEPRLVREVSETAGSVATTAADRTATEVAQRIVEENTAEIRERIDQLESLRDLQQRVEAERHAAASGLMDKVRERPDFDSTVELLVEAREKALFSERIHLRCGSNQDFLMYLYIGDHLVFLALGEDPIEDGQGPIEITVYSPTDTFPSAESYWWAGEPVEEAWNSLLDACERKSVPIEGIDLTDVFESLAASYGAMIEARRSPAGDPRRLQGKLRFLVNDEWAMTTAGLESRLSTHSFTLEVCPEGHDTSQWEEAVYYAPLFLAPS